MKGVAFLFFGLAVLCATGGMVWGLIMAASGDHTLLSAHAHLNLVGWVTFALIGVFYHLVPHAAATRLAKIHLVLSVVGVGLMVPGIAIAVSGGPEGLAIAGSVLTFAAMLVFVWTVWRRGPSAA